jgi:hypothetical protein
MPSLELNLKGEFERVFNQLWWNCVRTRNAGIELRMDFGRALAEMRAFLLENQQLGNSFALVCEALEIDEDDARQRIALSITWDTLRQHLQEHGLDIAMPTTDSHIAALFAVGLDRRAETWVRVYEEAIVTRTAISAKWMDACIENLRALPVPVTQVETEEEPAKPKEQPSEPEAEPTDIDFDAPEEEQARVPAPDDDTAPGDGPEFAHPDEIKKAIIRISNVCGGGNAVAVERWRKAISDPIKIKFGDLIVWEKHSDADIRRIANLIHDDFGIGLRRAIRIIDWKVDIKTRLGELLNQCAANGGRWEHTEAGYRILVTKMKDI